MRKHFHRQTCLYVVWMLTAVGATGSGWANFIRRDMPAGFHLIYNPMQSSNLSVGSLLPAVPEDVQLIVHDGDRWITNRFSNGAWQDPGMTLPMGKGAIVHTPVAWTIFWVGGIWEGNLAVMIPEGVSVVGSPVPFAGPIGFYRDGSEFPAPEDLELFTLDRVSGAEVFLARFQNGAWLPALPSLVPGEAVLVKSPRTFAWRWRFLYDRELADPNWPQFIAVQPQDASAYRGRPFQLPMEAQPSLAVSFQWQRNGHDVLGATNATFTVPLVTEKTAGRYWVRVTDGMAMHTSAIATVLVKEPEGVLAISKSPGTTGVLLQPVVLPGWTTHFEYSTNLLEWLPLEGLIFQGNATFHDPGTGGQGRRYYRLRLD